MIYCLDTDILIEYFRGNEAIKGKIVSLTAGDSLGPVWLTVYEFFKGIFVSGKLGEEKFLQELVESCFILEPSYETAKIGGEIYAGLKKAGRLINDALVVMQIDGDDEFNNWARKAALSVGEKDKPIVYITITELKPVRSRIVE